MRRPGQRLQARLGHRATSLTAILPHTTRNTLTLVHINLTSATLLSTSSSTTAGINNAFLDIRGEREESLFHIDV